MCQLGNDMTSMIILSTQSPRMTEAVLKTMECLLMVIQSTFLVLQIRIPLKHAWLTMESFKIFENLIMVNLEYLSSNVSGSMEIPVCVKTKWDLL